MERQLNDTHDTLSNTSGSRKSIQSKESSVDEAINYLTDEILRQQHVFELSYGKSVRRITEEEEESLVKRALKTLKSSATLLKECDSIKRE